MSVGGTKVPEPRPGTLRSSGSSSSKCGRRRRRRRWESVLSPPSSPGKSGNAALAILVVVGSLLVLLLVRPRIASEGSRSRPVVGNMSSSFSLLSSDRGVEESASNEGQEQESYTAYQLFDEGTYLSTRYRRYSAIRWDRQRNESLPVTVGQWARGLARAGNARRLSDVIVEAGRPSSPWNVQYGASRFQAVFWETPSVRPSTLETQPMEFVLVDAPRLQQFAAVSDPSFFAEHFRQCHGETEEEAPVVGCVFESLGRDAVLISPRPVAADVVPPVNAAHLMAYLQSAPSHLSNSLWKAVGETYLATLQKARASDDPFWLSTSGMGVPYLHVRVDRRPKYYTYDPYKLE